jgi:hypothetical protein
MAMFRFGLCALDGDDLGQVVHVVQVDVGELIWAGDDEDSPVIALIPAESA